MVGVGQRWSPPRLTGVRRALAEEREHCRWCRADGQLSPFAPHAPPPLLTGSRPSTECGCWRGRACSGPAFLSCSTHHVQEAPNLIHSGIWSQQPQPARDQMAALRRRLPPAGPPPAVGAAAKRIRTARANRHALSHTASSAPSAQQQPPRNTLSQAGSRPEHGRGQDTAADRSPCSLRAW